MKMKLKLGGTGHVGKSAKQKVVEMFVDFYIKPVYRTRRHHTNLMNIILEQG